MLGIKSIIEQSIYPNFKKCFFLKNTLRELFIYFRTFNLSKIYRYLLSKNGFLCYDYTNSYMERPTPTPPPDKPLSRRQQKRQRVQQRQNLQTQLLPTNRRKITRRGFFKIAGITAATVGLAAVGIKVGTEMTREKTLAEKIEAFSWEDVKNPEKLQALTKLLVDEYVNRTKTTTMTAQELVSPEHIAFYEKESDF